MIKSVQKATNILTLLSNNFGNPITISEISQQLSLNKATCCHLIETLENEGFITKVSRSKGYILGPAAFYLTRYGNYRNTLITTIKPVINFLHQNLNHTVIVAIIEGNQKYIIDYIDEEDLYDEKPKILLDDIYRTATGRAILANLSTEELYKIFKKLGTPKTNEWPEIASLNDLYDFAKNAKKDGIFQTFLQTENERYYGFASALFNKTKCVGSIGVAVKTQNNLPQQEENKIITLLSQSVKMANNQLHSLKT